MEVTQLSQLPVHVCFYMENKTNDLLGSPSINLCQYPNEWSQTFNDYYQLAMSMADKRVLNWPLMGNPIPVLLIAASYLALSVLGPRVMEKRKAFDLRWLIVVYNLVMSLVNGYMSTKVLYLTTKLQYSYLCMPTVYTSNPSMDPDELEILRMFYLSFITKIIDFSDTLFFILRKKNNQLTFLHVYHHTSMFIFWWGIMHWLTTGPTFQGLIVNSYVHFVMYLYYGLAALGPTFQKYLWWKRYLTRVQLTQFVYAAVVASIHVYNRCALPDWIKYLCIGYMFTLIGLFGNFYYHAYREKKAPNTSSGSKKDVNGETINGKNISNGHTSSNGKGIGNGLKENGTNPKRPTSLYTTTEEIRKRKNDDDKDNKGSL